MSTDSIVTLTTEAQAQHVLELMFQGKNKKDSCAEAGLSTKAFDRFLAASPEFVQQFKISIRAEFANFTDMIVENRRKNMQAKFALNEELRQVLISGELKEQLAALGAINKIDKDTDALLEMILPTVKEAAPSGPPKMEDDAALAILAQLNGGPVTVTTVKTVEVNQPEVIEGTTSISERETSAV